jgi:hypothetical protein
MKRGILIQAAIVLMAVSFASAQAIKKVRVLAAPGVTRTKPKDWHNTLGVSGNALILQCPKCSPIHTISLPAKQIASLRYGQNAYHHWIAGAVTGFFTLGIGAIVGFWPHHQDFFSVDLKDGKVLAMQADKGNYKEMAGMLQNFAGLPIEVSAKDAHFLAGFNTKVIGASK